MRALFLFAFAAVTTVSSEDIGTEKSTQNVAALADRLEKLEAMNSELKKQLEASQARQFQFKRSNGPDDNATTAAPAATTAAPAAAEDTTAAPAGGSGALGPPDWDPNSASPDTSKLQMIPFGKHVPRESGKEYLIATGRQECIICQSIVSEAYVMGPQYVNLFGYHVRDDVNVPMGHAQARVLQSCPEFVNDWCYQDLGGTQMLRSPCPDFLKCHYCLGLNPLHCLSDG
eukprot:g2176.t1